MRNLTAQGRDQLAGIARRHGVSDDAALTMLNAVANGGGTMAQFNHPELGGGGQWMAGGMIMVGDMFNNGLKNTVANLCGDLAAMVLNPAPGTWEEAPAASGGSLGGGSLGGGAFGGGWWPAELGSPNSSGSQNDVRYAYFGGTQRLAVEVGGVMTVYDTGDHMISGVSQQQGGGWNITFTSQYGTVPVSTLRIVSGGGGGSNTLPPAPPSPSVSSDTYAPPSPPPPTVAAPPPATTDGLTGTSWRLELEGSGSGPMITLEADGSVSGGDQRTRYWSEDDGVPTFYDGDGRVTARFPGGGGTATLMRGHDPSAPERTYLLRSPLHVDGVAPTATPQAQSSTLPMDLTQGGWVLEDVNMYQLAAMRFSADGRVEGGRPTEASWRIKDDALVFSHGSGRPTARFDTFQFRGGRWTLIGSPINDASVSLFLKQI